MSNFLIPAIENSPHARVSPENLPAPIPNATPYKLLGDLSRAHFPAGPKLHDQAADSHFGAVRDQLVVALGESEWRLVQAVVFGVGSSSTTVFDAQTARFHQPGPPNFI